MDLKSRGRIGRSFIQRATRSRTSAPVHKNRDQLDTDDDLLARKVDALFSGQDVLFERLHTEPKWHSVRRAYKSTAKSIKVFTAKQSVLAKVASAIVVPLLIAGVYKLSHIPTNQKINEVAGVTSSKESSASAGQGGLPREKPTISLLIPKGKTVSGLDVVRISPEGNDVVYAYIDKYEGQDIMLSQQKVPKAFDYNRNAELERVAKEFQATDVIQVDANKIYHGLSDKTKQQSLIFIKNDRLVFIKSPAVLSDSLWASYYLGLSND